MRRSDLRAIAFRIVGRADVVDDVMQDAYVKLVAGACSRDILNPFAYCCQVVRNMALDYYRRHVVEASIVVSTPDGNLPDIAGDHRADAGIDERRLLERIETVLSTLPERTRFVFEHYRLHGKTQREIGKIIGVSATLVNFIIKDVMQSLDACRDGFDE